MPPKTRQRLRSGEGEVAKGKPKKDEVMLKLMLQTAQQVRTLRSVALVTFTVKAESELYKILERTGQNYATKAKEAGKDHKLGPPFLHLWNAMVALLLAKGADEVGVANHAAIVEYEKELALQSMEEASLQVRACKISKMYDPAYKRLELSAPGVKCSANIWQALRAMGAILKVGQMPNTGLEVLAQEMLEDMML